MLIKEGLFVLFNYLYVSTLFFLSSPPISRQLVSSILPKNVLLPPISRSTTICILLTSPLLSFPPVCSVCSVSPVRIPNKKIAQLPFGSWAIFVSYELFLMIALLISNLFFVTESINFLLRALMFLSLNLANSFLLISCSPLHFNSNNRTYLACRFGYPAPAIRLDMS